MARGGAGEVVRHDVQPDIDAPGTVFYAMALLPSDLLRGVDIDEDATVHDSGWVGLDTVALVGRAQAGAHIEGPSVQRAHEHGVILVNVETAGCGIPAHDRGASMPSHERLRLMRTDIAQREYFTVPADEHHFPAPRAS